ncbi:MAG TPA: MBL fold metallo-hydrolase, partial [Geobacteraceae bacterium]|nr:MBL fold metallo-hydrolase [Geobacteraceae bacterium]
RLLAPALWKLGVTRIDYLVLSHPHPDHVQGLRYIAANFPVGEYWEGAGPVGSADHLELLRILFRRQVPVRKLDAASPAISVGGAAIEPLSPPPGRTPSPPEEESDLNDDSLVFRLVYGDFRMLFTGDIGVATEERLLLRPERLKCSVLKVPHHGSRFSSSLPFLTATAPGTALIAAGYRNSFHLPARETLDRLAGLRIPVYRTDVDGTVRIITDGRRESLSIEKHPGAF